MLEQNLNKCCRDIKNIEMTMNLENNIINFRCKICGFHFWDPELEKYLTKQEIKTAK